MRLPTPVFTPAPMSVTRARLQRSVRLWRPAAVALAASALALAMNVALWHLATAPWTSPSDAPAPSGPPPLTFDRLLTSTSSIALALCVLWAWAATIVTVVDSLRALHSAPACPPAASARSVRLPVAGRRLVLALCGVALSTTAAPALAAPAGSGPGSAPATSIEAIAATLPFPDRATDTNATGLPPATPATPTTPAPERSRHIQVSAGESLWSITAERLGSADAGAIDRHWRELYRLNQSVIGADPDRLRPGQRLLLPRSLR